MNRKLLCAGLCAIMALGMAMTVFAEAPRNVQLFQSPVRDVNTSGLNYVDIRGAYSTTSVEGSDSDPSDIIGRAILGIPLGETFELNAQGGFKRHDTGVDDVDAESGLTDLEVAARARFNGGENALFSVGAGSTIPVGKEELGYGNSLTLTGFGAMHYNASPTLRVTGAASIEYTNFDDVESGSALGMGRLATTNVSKDSETALRIAPGIILEATPEVAIVGELSLGTYLSDVPDGYEYPSIISGGVDYMMNANGSLRGAIGIGLNDAASDLSVQGGYVITFN